MLGLNKKTEAAVAFVHCLARDPDNKGVKKSLAKVHVCPVSFQLEGREDGQVSLKPGSH